MVDKKIAICYSNAIASSSSSVACREQYVLYSSLVLVE